jgi:DNA-binding response OmpR family regulator
VKTNRVLVVDDDRELASLIVQAMNESGYISAAAHNGRVGLERAEDFDLLIVDVMMPSMNGFEMVETLRGQGNRTPVIFLTARDASKDVIRGLDVGGDDYIVKPFRLDELFARVRSLLRRSSDASHILNWTDIEIDYARRSLTRNGHSISLSATEFAVFDLLVQESGKVVSKSKILSEVWNDDGYRDENLVELYINYIRKKTEAFGGTRIIQTIRGRGYLLKPPDDQP